MLLIPQAVLKSVQRSAPEICTRSLHGFTGQRNSGGQWGCGGGALNAAFSCRTESHCSSTSTASPLSMPGFTLSSRKSPQFNKPQSSRTVSAPLSTDPALGQFRYAPGGQAPSKLQMHLATPQESAVAYGPPLWQGCF